MNPEQTGSALPNLSIGRVNLENPLILAPLAGITNLPFRLLAKTWGCGLVCSEMISANGLVHGSAKTLKMLDSHPDEKPLSVQIFGADPEMMADAAQIVAASGADILDINFGCSVRKVVKTGAGAALMRTPKLTGAVLAAVRQKVDLPVTIKIRSGWDKSGDQALSIAQMAQDLGVDAVAVHPRSATQGFSGKADWSVIRRIKQRLSIPVIGNGDVTDESSALSMMGQTGCHGVMIGRAAIGSPWIFGRILASLKGLPRPEISLEKRRRVMIQFVADSVAYLGQKTACFMMRSRLCWFVKGLPMAKHFREAIKRVESQDQAREIIDTYFSDLADRENLEAAPYVS